MATATYQPVAFTELPGWADDDHAAALQAFRASCPRVVARSAAKGADRPGLTAGLLDVCQTVLAMPERVTRSEARGVFERYFTPHRVIHSATEGLLTGYYEPVIEGSRTRQGRFQTPILKRPPDLVTVVPETRGSVRGGLTHARRTGDGLVPFATRAEIEAGALAGDRLDLIYLTDPVEKFFLQIQGSGLIRLTDGTTTRVQYDGKNGHPYSSIGRYLIDRGLVAADKMSMGALGRWLKSDLDRARLVMNQNPSYVFFKEAPSGARGPEGALQVPLVPGRSLAIDPTRHRLGSPVYVTVPGLHLPGDARPFARLMIAHDVGSAIRGPERGDIYFGSGDAAARLAGALRHAGNLVVFLPAAPRATGAKEARGRAPDSR
jgi:membrane-bound lytic murein transglycosylase A